MRFVIDSLSIATEGFISSVKNGNQTLSIATRGFIVTLTEEIITVPPLLTGGIGGPKGGGKRHKKKRITATIILADGEKVVESVEFDDINVKLSDVKVVVETKDNRPNIKITLLS